MHSCNGCHGDGWKHQIWHGFYRAWYDHVQSGQNVRAAILGRLADAWCRIVWP